MISGFVAHLFNVKMAKLFEMDLAIIEGSDRGQ